MFFLIMAFNFMMYIGSKIILGMLGEYYDDKNSYLLNIACCSIFAGVYFTKNLLNISAMLYLILFIYITYELFIVTSFCKSYIKFVKIEAK